jgi:hypothetical protein
MDKETRLRFLIERPDLEPDELDVDAAQALIGSGAHCEVRLDAKDAAAEQLLVSATATELTAIIRSVSPPTLLEGAPFARGPIAEGAVFTIGACRVRVHRQRAEASARVAASERRPGKLLLAALGLLLAALGVTLLIGPTPTGALPPRPGIPPLYSPSEAQPCARTAPDQAQRLGNELWEAALLKQERSPYYLKDAMAAVILFQRAAACFERAAAPASVARSEREFERLLLQLAADYHRHHVLLERALEQNDWRTLQREAAALCDLLGDRHPEYTNWLGNVLRLAELMVAKSTKT